VPIFVGRGAPLYDFLRQRFRLARNRRSAPPAVSMPATGSMLGARSRLTNC